MRSAQDFFARTRAGFFLPAFFALYCTNVQNKLRYRVYSSRAVVLGRAGGSGATACWDVYHPGSGLL